MIQEAMIGGNDIYLKGPLSEEQECLLFETIQRTWPESVVREAPSEKGSRHIFVYRTSEVERQVEALGIVPEIEGHTIYVILAPEGLTCVVGDEGTPGDFLVRAIGAALDRTPESIWALTAARVAPMQTWTDAIGARYDVDRALQVRCPCGQSATATLLTVTVPPHPPLVTKWFRPPAPWFVALTGDLKCIDDAKVIEGPFVRCPKCIHLSRPGKGPLATAAEGRPENFDELDAQAKWDIDKSLGILDWSGDPKE